MPPRTVGEITMQSIENKIYACLSSSIEQKAIFFVFVQGFLRAHGDHNKR